MKMSFFFPVFLMPVLLSTMISINQFIPGVKASLTPTELDISGLKVEEIFPVIAQVILRSFAFQPRILFENSIRPDLDDKSNVSNTSLNFLYLAHSPPFLS